VVDAAERREKFMAEIVERTGITEALIERLVRAFYTKVRAGWDEASVISRLERFQIPLRWR
jgi:hypothetical protein